MRAEGCLRVILRTTCWSHDEGKFGGKVFKFGIATDRVLFSL